MRKRQLSKRKRDPLGLCRRYRCPACTLGRGRGWTHYYCELGDGHTGICRPVQCDVRGGRTTRGVPGAI